MSAIDDSKRCRNCQFSISDNARVGCLKSESGFQEIEKVKIGLVGQCPDFEKINSFGI